MIHSTWLYSVGSWNFNLFLDVLPLFWEFFYAKFSDPMKSSNVMEMDVYYKEYLKEY